MAVRQSLISQASQATQPLQASPVRADPGAFGDYSGMASTGQALQQVGDQVSSTMLAFRQKEMQRTASDIQHRTRVLVAKEATRVNKGYTDAKLAGKTGDELFRILEQEKKTSLENIRIGMEDLQKKDPVTYSKVVTPNYLESSWAGVQSGYEDDAIGHTASVTMKRRETDTEQEDQYTFAAESANPAGAIGARVEVEKDIESRRDQFSENFIRQRRSQADQATVNTIIAGASRGDPSAMGAAKYALAQGWMTPTQFEQAKAHFSSATNPEVGAAELRKNATDSNELVAGNNPENPAVRDLKLAAAASTYKTTESKWSGVILPAILAKAKGMVVEASSNGTLSQIGDNFLSIQTFSASLNDPNDQDAEFFLRQKFKVARQASRNELGVSRALFDETANMEPSDEDLSKLRQFYQQEVQRVTKLFESRHGLEFYKNDPEMQRILATGTGEQIADYQDRLYSRDQIPASLRVYGDPDRMAAIEKMITSNDPARVNDIITEIDAMSQKFGDKAYGAMRMLGASSDSPIAGIVFHQSSKHNAMTRQDAYEIELRRGTMISATSYANSRAAQESEKANPETASLRKATLDRALEQSFMDSPGLVELVVLSPKDAFQRFRDQATSPRTSALGQALMSEGAFDSTYKLAHDLMLWYTEGSGQGAMPVAEAAKKVREDLGVSHVPFASNGGGADRKAWTLGPASSDRVASIQPGKKGVFANQGDFSAAYTAALDSDFIADSPVLNFAGSVQWLTSDFLSTLFSGPKFGDNTGNLILKNVDTRFNNLLGRSIQSGTTAFKTRGIDFASIGIEQQNIKGERTFVPLSEDRIVTSYLPEQAKAWAKEQLTKVNADDIAGRNKVVLGNNFYRKQNPSTRSWDYFIKGRDGSLAQVMSKQKDGSLKTLSIPFDDVDRKLDAFMNMASWMNREGSESQVLSEEARKNMGDFSKILGKKGP